LRGCAADRWSSFACRSTQPRRRRRDSPSRKSLTERAARCASWLRIVSSSNRRGSRWRTLRHSEGLPRDETVTINLAISPELMLSSRMEPNVRNCARGGLLQSARRANSTCGLGEEIIRCRTCWARGDGLIPALVQRREAAIELLLEGERHAPIREELLPHAFYCGCLVEWTDRLKRCDFASNVVGSAMATVSAALFTSRSNVPCRMRRIYLHRRRRLPRTP